MVNIEYHKGQLCSFKPLLCQEGFCAECIISHEHHLQKTPTFVKENTQITSKTKINNTARQQDRVADPK